MSYLLAKIFFLLLLSAFGGALLMYWWVRRRYQDITLAYTNSQSNLQNLESSYATLNEKNIILQNTIHEKIDNILTTVNPLEKAIINIDANQKLKTIEENITTIESSLTHIPELLTENKIAIMDTLNKNHSSRLQPSDLLPITNAINNIDIPKQEKTDLSPVLTAIKNIKIPEQEKINLEPFINAIENVRIPEPKAPNLEPILMAIKNLQIEKPKSIEIKEKIINGNRLHKASFGLPDDLKIIKGIGVTLEKMLHNIGVYYYWQIAEWTPKDVQDVDNQLEVFKGRIDRDNWIEQANELFKLPTSVKKETM